MVFGCEVRSARGLSLLGRSLIAIFRIGDLEISLYTFEATSMPASRFRGPWNLSSALISPLAQWSKELNNFFSSNQTPSQQSEPFWVGGVELLGTRVLSCGHLLIGRLRFSH